MKTLTEQLACLKREAALRKNVYPKWVANGRMTREKAQHEIDAMTDACATVEKAMVLEQVSEEMKKPKQPEFLSQALNEGDGVYRP